MKPHNILVSRVGDRKVLKIADFGFARIIRDEALAQTQCGSPLYMAPEILLGEEYTNKADLWSVGVILYEMLCGERPFKNITDITALQRKVKNEPIRFRSDINISKSCRHLLKELLQKDYRKRISFDDFFNHEWFSIDWNKPIQEELKLEDNTYVKKTSTQPIAIPNRRNSRMNVINNYVDRLSSAPARTETAMPPIVSPKDGSIFLSTTPQGYSDPFGEETSTGFSTSSSRFGEFMSTSFSLLKDSFQGQGF